MEIGCGAHLPGATTIEAFIPSIEYGRGVEFGEQAGGRVCLPHLPSWGHPLSLICTLGSCLDK